MSRTLRSAAGALLAAALVVGGLAPLGGAAHAASPVLLADTGGDPAPTPTPTPTPTVPAATTFAMPLAAGTYNVSSYYGPRCIPLPGASTFHAGIDLGAKGGAPIYAIAAGIVTGTVDGTSTRAGYVKIMHMVDGVEFTSFYLHIWKSTTYVKVGQVVEAGQRISSVGTSGGSSGNHLHLELWMAATPKALLQNPVSFLTAHGVNLYGNASAVVAQKAPATCRYYSTGTLNFRTGPSTSSAVIRQLPKGAAMIHVPGKITSGYIPVQIGTRHGWVSSSYVTPVKPPTYRTTTRAPMRPGPGTATGKILTIPKGAVVGVIQATHGNWRKVIYKGHTGWISSSRIVKR